jgi:hypothetical protein
MSDQLVAKDSAWDNATYKQGTNIHARSGIRIRDLSNQAAVIFASDSTATGTGINTTCLLQ